MNEENRKVPRRIAQTVLNSLKGGVVPRVGLPYITVGRKSEIEALLHDVDISEEGGAFLPVHRRTLRQRARASCIQTMRQLRHGQRASSRPTPTSPPERGSDGHPGPGPGHLPGAHAATCPSKHESPRAAPSRLVLETAGLAACSPRPCRRQA